MKEMKLSGATQKMLDVVKAMPEHLEKASSLAEAVKLPATLKKAPAIALAGMGGSAIGGDIINCCFQDSLKSSFIVNRFYNLPNYLKQGDLFVASSYSGNTEETLAAFAEARKRKMKILVVSGGGKLVAAAKKHKLPWLTIPPGFQPRAALGFMTIGPLVLLSRLGYVPPVGEDIKECVALLEAMRSEFSGLGTRSLPVGLAESWHGRNIVICGSEPMTKALAMRWKGQINENAKSMAFYNVLPELNHNEIVGWEAQAGLSRNTVVVFLRDSSDHPQVKRRIDFTLSLIKGQVGEVQEVYSRGNSTLARALSLIFIGDLASVFLAELNGVDPTPVRIIENLKKLLAGK